MRKTIRPLKKSESVPDVDERKSLLPQGTNLPQTKITSVSSIRGGNAHMAVLVHYWLKVYPAPKAIPHVVADSVHLAQNHDRAATEERTVDTGIHGFAEIP